MMLLPAMAREDAEYEGRGKRHGGIGVKMG